MKVWHFLGVCLLLAAASAARPEVSETDYFAVFMEGKKVGHVMQSRVIAETKVRTTINMNVTVSRLGFPITINTMETYIETINGKPLGFEFVQELSGIPMRVTGTVNEQGSIDITAASMGAEQKSTLDWPSGALMAEGLRLLQLKKGLKQGLTYTAKVFAPSMLQTIDARIQIGPKRNVDLLGRVVALREVTTAMTMPMVGEIVSTSYVDDELRMQKTVMPMMGMQIEMVACAKEFALGQNDVLELINKMFLPSPVPLEKVGSAKAIAYHLVPIGDANSPMIPSTDNQSVRLGKDGIIVVTVEPVATPAGARFPYKGKDKAILEAVKPTRFLQSDDKRIIKLARRAIGRTKDAAEAAKRIEAFVAKYIDNKNLSVGYASAVEVAASRQGDCTEHAVLTAAMCRAIGIPAQVVTGVAYVDDFAGLRGFGGHAWAQAYVGGKWIGLDAAFKGTERGGYDAGHIALAVGNGNPEDFFVLAKILGQFKIDKMVVIKEAGGI